MRLAFAALLPALAVLVGCAELPLQERPSVVLDGVPIYGRADQIPEPELRAAIALDRSLTTAAARNIYLIDAIRRAELYDVHEPCASGAFHKRVAGKWHVQDRVVGGSIRFP